MIEFQNHGQERDLICTEQEREIFDLIVAEFPDENLRLTRLSDNYVSIKRGEWDIVRFKYTKRAKWLMFPTIEAKQVKHYIEDLDETEDYVAAIKDSLEIAKKYE